MSRPASVLGYTTGEVARLLRTNGERVRSFVRSGFLEPGRGPRREYRFRFQDLVVLRAALALADDGVPSRRLRRVLRELREDLPRGRSLAELSVTFEGSRFIVRACGQAWEAESGQRLLTFDVAELAARAEPLAPRLVERAGPPEALGAEDWYELGFELEASSIAEAEGAYRKALNLDPAHADAHLNLGRLLHLGGDPGRAAEHYEAALAGRPEDATAAFNLGVSLQDRDERDRAASCYRSALESDPAMADAHFNLAVLLEDEGESARALAHLKAYMRLQGLRVGLGRRRPPR